MSDFPGNTTVHGAPPGDVAPAGQALASTRSAAEGDLAAQVVVLELEEITDPAELAAARAELDAAPRSRRR